MAPFSADVVLDYHQRQNLSHPTPNLYPKKDPAPGDKNVLARTFSVTDHRNPTELAYLQQQKASDMGDDAFLQRENRRSSKIGLPYQFSQDSALLKVNLLCTI